MTTIKSPQANPSLGEIEVAGGDRVRVRSVRILPIDHVAFVGPDGVCWQGREVQKLRVWRLR